MKFRGLILVIIIAVGTALLFMLPEKKEYGEVAAVGKPAPDFVLVDSKGNRWQLSEQRGKVVFINFWATWCSVCKEEMRSKEVIYNKFKDKPFQMLGMLFRDDPANLRSYFKEVKVSLPTLISPDNESAKLYGITGVPETFIIDKDGIVREKLVGPRKWDAEENIALIEKWL